MTNGGQRPQSVEGKSTLKISIRLICLGAFVKDVLAGTELHEEMAAMMSDFPNDNHKTEPVSHLAGLLQQSKNRKNGLNARIPGAFENWLMEYRNRLAKVFQGETRNTRNG
jgi:hypothetical protein